MNTENQTDSDPTPTSGRRVRPMVVGLVVFIAILVGAAGGYGLLAYSDLGGSSAADRQSPRAEADTPQTDQPEAGERARTERPMDRSAHARLTPVQHRNGDQSIPDLVERLLPAVVSISVTQGGQQQQTQDQAEREDPREDFRRFFRERPPRRGQAVGSGFIVDPNGLIVTNHHVVQNASSVRVIMHDGRQFNAEIRGLDPRADLALLEVETDEPLPSVSWGDSSSVRVGESVVAIGNPFGLSSTVTAGIVSARGRFIPGNARGASFVDFIQTDAAINRGNSGGPLFNMNGEVIGINTAIYSNRGTNVGVAFAVPSDIARVVIDQLREYGRTRRGWLGVSIQTVTDEIAQSLGLDQSGGALVADVIADSPAARAGILRGDVILRFNNRTVTDSRRLPRLVAGTPSGEDVSVVVWRQGEEVTLDVTLGELEQASQQHPNGKSDDEQEQQGSRMMVQGMRVASLTPDLRQRFRVAEDINGLLILEVDGDSRAAEKAIQPGDLILEANQQEVTDPGDFQRQIEEALEAGRGSILLLIQTEGGNRRFVALRIEE